MMFAKLQAVRDTLAAVPAFSVDAETRAALVEAINELGEAMVQDVRTENYRRTLPPVSDTHTHELLALFAGSTTCGELVQ